MDLQKDAFHRAEQVLTELGDQELLAAYKAYIERLEEALGAGWLDTYASMYQRDRRQLTGQTEGAPTQPEETTLRERAIADRQIVELYDRFITLLANKNLLDKYYVRE